MTTNKTLEKRLDALEQNAGAEVAVVFGDDPAPRAKHVIRLDEEDRDL